MGLLAPLACRMRKYLLPAAAIASVIGIILFFVYYADLALSFYGSR